MRRTPFDRPGFSLTCGVLLAQARKSRGYSQERLSRKIGISRPQLANIETGRSRMYLDVVWRCAIVLGVNIITLMPERPFS
jgi:transcriptional regulator with XRE-family HTH domain